MNQKTVAVIGAGPAGLFAAKTLAEKDVKVALFNRDVRPGGLAEYGIYPEKTSLKKGLRRQFMSFLSHKNITYFGNMEIGENKDLSLAQLRAMGFQGILIAAGAQKLRELKVEGEFLPRVYHAWEIVSKYNDLPPYSQIDYPIGKKVLIVGVGNVMADVARYLLQKGDVEEILVIARRGPAEIKFHETEFAHIAQNLDRADFEAEMERVTSLMLKLGQDPNATWAFIEKACENCDEKTSSANLRLRFLKSPVQFLGNENEGLQEVKCVENTLVEENHVMKTVPTSLHALFDVDTAILAVGSSVDDEMGLPVSDDLFTVSPYPDYPQDGISYEVMDPVLEKNISGIFLAGWSRLASYGLVGISGKDGMKGAHAAYEFLQEQDIDCPDWQVLESKILDSKKTVVNKNMVDQLYALEAEIAQKKGLADYKFAANQEMLAAVGLV
ncbi:MAG TPA: FAD-dependent oxidoreductase [Anaerolineaceae bacterium]|nr:FAD-dependent oxidoreductase [Anaerolineaceae bacterium]